VNTQGRSDTRVELLRVLGALSVFAYHFMGDAETTLRPVLAHDAVWSAVRHGSGPFGVSLFIIISGVVFTWSWQRAGRPVQFVRRRLGSLYSLYWWIALPLIVLALATHRMPMSEAWKVPLWLGGLGILSPSTFFPVVDAWWYMALALQLVLLYPLLRRLQDGIGLQGFMIGAAVVSIASTWALTALGLTYAVAGFIGSRLAEFAFGMTIGRTVGTGARAWPRVSVLLAMGLALGVCILGLPQLRTHIALALTIALLSFGMIGNASGAVGKAAMAAGGLSFAFYLSHSPWAKPILTSVVGIGSTEVAIALAAGLSLAVAALVAWGFLSSFHVARDVLARVFSSKAGVA
jgi:peptidoglycan/LPS O-acetylase OafA/YrhL